MSSTMAALQLQRKAGFRRSEALRPSTRDPWTRDFKHLLPIPRYWTKSLDRRRNPPVRAVPPKDRIKYWNIVPGDQIRIRGDRDGTIHEVQAINKLRNRVYLRSKEKKEDESQGTNSQRARNILYANCQLFIGNFDFPSRDASDQPRVTPVFAFRLGTTKPHWLPTERRWNWERFAIKTVPKIPERIPEERLVIPWPQVEKHPDPEPTSLDTTVDAVTQVTYQVPPLPRLFTSSTPKVANEDEYIKWLYDPSSVSSNATNFMEIHLRKELSNPHSRAKKQARWQARQVHKQELLQSYLKRELKVSASRNQTAKEARAEATWKWQMAIEEEEKTLKNRKWRNEGLRARLLRKKERKAKKVVLQRRRLAEMVLTGGRNQVMPVSQPTLLDSNT